MGREEKDEGEYKRRDSKIKDHLTGSMETLYSISFLKYENILRCYFKNCQIMTETEHQMDISCLQMTFPVSGLVSI